ncbi:hypothetical protein E4T56_gene20128 [Termitomyces sp. T112]|nr:hypothetical protein E4T56_gene20128 [Termitomyces sp. T112]KAH0590214.1 hypothetical protein H2248_000386 [Termitomyces sp. 'cryptogamus']
MLSSCLADDLFYLECDHDGTDDRRPQLSTAAPIMTFQRHSLLRSSPRCDTTLHLSRLSVYPLIIQSNQILQTPSNTILAALLEQCGRSEISRHRQDFVLSVAKFFRRFVLYRR